jgi:P pilus assembly chaperone PapD
VIALLQVATIVTLLHGSATSLVRNPARQPVAVAVTTWRSLADTTPVRALIAPPTFTLQPGESQVLRIRAREACAAGWRLVTTFTPVAAPVQAVTVPVARITLVTRIVGKLLCSPSS